MALQEIARKETVQKICDELNNPTLPSVSKWKGPKGQWECIVSPSPIGRMFQGVEYAGFLYDTDQEVSLLSSSLIESATAEGEKRFVRKPYLAHFSVSNLFTSCCCVLIFYCVPFDKNIVINLIRYSKQ